MNFLKSRLFRLIASLGLAALFYFLCPPCFNKMYLLVVLILLVLIINLDKYIVKARFLTHLTRIAVGGLFIFSGFIKANDPAGFSYKLEEYFQVFGQGFSCDMKVAGPVSSAIPCEQEALDRAASEKKQKELDAKIAADPNYVEPQIIQEPSSLKPLWDFFAHHSLALAIIICGVEILLGIFLLIGWQARLSLWLFLAMIVFFSFLTFYSACCNKVASCGCFGDAIPLTPWESFWKDLILLVLIALLFSGKENITPISSNRILMAGLIGIGTFASFAFPIYTYRHLPIIDFRPYAIGTNMLEAIHGKDPATSGCVNDSTVFTYYYKQDGTNKMMHFISMDSFPDSTWQYYCRQESKIRKGNCSATIMDFNMSDPITGEAMNDSILHMKGIVFFLVMYDMDLAEREVMGQVNLFYDAAAKSNVPFYGLTNVAEDKISTFRTETGAKYPFMTVDPTALKTIIRSNPGLVMLKDGVVTGMWHANDFPVFSEVTQQYGSK
ncbi:MAG TPA: BT_3928 family protein [Bacteroidia bacterium]|nr:BT_3928 family protein [Bacteroidia bacterium]